MRWLLPLLLCLGFFSASALGGNTAELLAKINELESSLSTSEKKVAKSLWTDLGVEIEPEIRHLFTGSSSERKRSGDKETIRVEIQAQVNEELLEVIRAEGKILFSSERFNSITAEVPPSLLSTLSKRPDVQFVGRPGKARTNKINTSEGVVNHRVKQILDAYPEFRGKGVKIGVLSDSVDYLSDSIASGDLPPNVVVLPGQGFEGQDGVGEGTAMLEIVHDMAPEAELYFATAFISPLSFASNIIDLANAGCQVIVDDISWSDESAFMDSVIAQAVDYVASNGVFYFSSAGNQGNTEPFSTRRRAYEADYKPMATTLPGYQSVHDFGDAKPFMGVAGDIFYLFLTWSEPDGQAVSDFDILLLDEDDNLLAISDGYEGWAYDDIFFERALGVYRIVVGFKSGSQDHVIRLITWNYGTMLSFELSTTGATWGHATAEGCFGISAIEQSNSSSFFELLSAGAELLPEPFTSGGPRRILFNPDGTEITPGNVKMSGGYLRNKPDFTAVDGVQTTVPLFFNPFYGTSAAAPHAAAIAAIALSAKPSLTVPELRSIFEATAMDIMQPGWDKTTGHGILDMVRVIEYLLNNNVCPNITCLNGGTCQNNVCLCKTGFVGNFCQNIAPCPPAADYAHASWPETPAGKVAQGSCVWGYASSPNGAPRRQCPPAGTQFASLVVNHCVRLKCVAVTEGGITWPQTDSLIIARQNCNAGEVGGLSRTCQGDGTWGPVSSTCLPTTTVAKCPPDVYGNANWNETAAGTVATGSCSSGYSGSPQRQCKLDGTWATLLTSFCQKKSCSGVTEGNANWPVTISGAATYGKCTGSYLGSPSRVCQADGSWGPISNPCSLPASSSCPGETYNRATWPVTPAGQTAAGACLAGFTGTPSRICKADGTWQDLVRNICSKS